MVGYEHLKLALGKLLSIPPWHCTADASSAALLLLLYEYPHVQEQLMQHTSPHTHTYIHTHTRADATHKPTHPHVHKHTHACTYIQQWMPSHSAHPCIIHISEQANAVLSISTPEASWHVGSQQVCVAGDECVGF